MDNNQSETVLGNMQLHIGPSRAGGVLAGKLRSLVEGISSIAVNLPDPGIAKIGRGIFSLFADNSINFATKGMMTEHVGVSKTLQVGHTLSAFTVTFFR